MGEKNVTGHTATLEFTYVDMNGVETVKFMGPLSLEQSPINVMSNDTRTKFLFQISAPDALTTYVANTRPPFNITDLQLPDSLTQQSSSEIIGWIDSKTILYKELQGQHKEKISYWSVSVDNIQDKKQINLQ